MFKREIPTPQVMFHDYGFREAPIFETQLLLPFSELLQNLGEVTQVADLYCGNGTFTLGSLLAFPKAHIHAVDYFDILVPDAKRNSRVTFYQGYVADILPNLPSCDIVILSLPGPVHELDAGNVNKLRAIVKRYLYTTTDSFMDFDTTPWFKNTFTSVPVKNNLYGAYDIWITK